jgi:iron-sulfur cluster assembly protein
MIQISEQAAKQITRLKQETAPSENSAATDSLHGSFLRVNVVPGGCSGMSYKLDFDQSVAANDRVFEEHGTKVVVDSKSLLYIAGMTLDFEGGLNGKGFIFSNPNASKTCGCGSSFGV